MFRIRYSGVLIHAFYIYVLLWWVYRYFQKAYPVVALTSLPVNNDLLVLITIFVLKSFCLIILQFSFGFHFYGISFFCLHFQSVPLHLK